MLAFQSRAPVGGATAPHRARLLALHACSPTAEQHANLSFLSVASWLTSESEGWQTVGHAIPSSRPPDPFIELKLKIGVPWPELPR